MIASAMRRAFVWITELPGWVTAGAGCGLASGLAVGAMTPSPGMALGLVLGLCAGAAAGAAVHKDERRRDARDRELDDIIGVTKGSLGAPPDSLRAPPDEAIAARAWLDEWLTPPPPSALL
jgi:hypothetical protein